MAEEKTVLVIDGKSYEISNPSITYYGKTVTQLTSLQEHDVECVPGDEIAIIFSCVDGHSIINQVYQNELDRKTVNVKVGNYINCAPRHRYSAGWQNDNFE